jgi:hypothetical protein
MNLEELNPKNIYLSLKVDITIPSGQEQKGTIQYKNGKYYLAMQTGSDKTVYHMTCQTVFELTDSGTGTLFFKGCNDVFKAFNTYSTILN